MHFVKSPSSVPSSFVIEDLKGRTESPVVRIAELGDEVQTNEDVVVVMNRVVEPEPGTVFFFSIIEELSLEIKLYLSLDRASNAYGHNLIGLLLIRSDY